MSTSNELFDLVSNLSKSEKRYFTLFADRQSGDKNYMKLFAVLDQMSEYNEAILYKKLKDEPFYSDLHVTKNYLQKLILRSMRMYTENKNLESKIQNYLSDGDFLLKKGITKLALTYYKKAEKIARTHERFPQLIDAQKRILNRLMVAEKDNLDAIAELEHQQAETANLLAANIRLSAIYREIFAYFRQNFRFKTESDKRYYTSQVADIKKPATTFKLQLLYYKILGTYYWLDDNHLEVNKFLRYIPEAYEQFPHFGIESPNSFMVAISNYLSSCARVGKTDEIPYWLEKLEVIPCHGLDDEATQFKTLYIQKLFYLLNTGQLKEAENLMPEIVTKLNLYADIVPASNLLTLYTNAITIYFVQEKFGLALDWVIKIAHIEKTAHRKDLQLFARIFQIIIHLELGNMEILESLLNAAQRVYKKDESLGELESLIFKKIKRIAAAPLPGERAKVFKSFRIKLEQLLPDMPTNYTGLEELQLWIEARGTGTPLRKLFEKKYHL